jgi:integration host factor subunit alpha
MSGKTVTRADLYQAIYQKIGLSRTECTTLVELVLKEITDCLERGETVKLSSFGLFVVRKKGQRMGRNPKTGEEAPISPRRVVVFKPSEVLKRRINAPRSHIDGTWNKEAWLTRFPCPPATLELLALVVGCVKRDQPCWPLLR